VPKSRKQRLKLIKLNLKNQNNVNRMYFKYYFNLCLKLEALELEIPVRIGLAFYQNIPPLFHRALTQQNIYTVYIYNLYISYIIESQ
jgi:hypothetical protein